MEGVSLGLFHIISASEYGWVKCPSICDQHLGCLNF